LIEPQRSIVIVGTASNGGITKVVPHAQRMFHHGCLSEDADLRAIGLTWLAHRGPSRQAVAAGDIASS
jgi:hypothetical protein